MSPTNGRLPLPGLTPDQRQLVLDHEGLAHYHANHFRSGIEQLDKDQIARYALCRAAQGFTGKPEDFHRYASSWIINQLSASTSFVTTSGLATRSPMTRTFPTPSRGCCVAQSGQTVSG